MNKTEFLKMSLEKLTAASNYIDTLGGVSKGYRMDIELLKAALEANDEKDGSPCPEFWDWLPKAYRNGDVDDLPKFTKYNMEVAFLAGKQSAALEAKDEPVATDWERIARVQNAKLMAVCDGAGGFEKLCEVMDKYEAITPTQRKPLTDDEVLRLLSKIDEYAVRLPRGLRDFARAIEAAHGIKGEA